MPTCKGLNQCFCYTVLLEPIPFLLFCNSDGNLEHNWDRLFSCLLSQETSGRNLSCYSDPSLTELVTLHCNLSKCFHNQGLTEQSTWNNTKLKSNIRMSHSHDYQNFGIDSPTYCHD